MLGTVVVLFFPFLASAAADVTPLTVEEAARLAAQHSKGAQLAQLKVAEARIDANAAKLLRYPRITAFGLGAYYFKPLDLKIRQGSLTPALDTLGVDLGVGPLSPLVGAFPATDLTLVRGSHTQLFGGLTILQPLTQQWRIDSGVRAATASRTAAERDTAHILAQIRVGVEELFAGILLEEKRQAQHAARAAFEERRLRDTMNANTVGEALDAAVLGYRATLVKARAELLRSTQHRAQLTLQLADLIGQPGVSELTLAPAMPERAVHPLEYWLAKTDQNPERLIAAATAEKARVGVRAARQAHIPDLSAFASGFAQDGLPLAPSNGGSVGLAVTWDIFDFGRRNAEIARSRSQQRAAELNVERLTEDASRLIRTAYQDFTFAEEQIALAGQAAAYRRRAAELAHQSAANGLALEATAFEADAALREAEADLVGAQLQRHVALLRLYFLAGELN